MTPLIVSTCEITGTLQRSLDHRGGLFAMVLSEALRKFIWLWGFKKTLRITKLFFFLSTKANTFY